MGIYPEVLKTIQDHREWIKYPCIWEMEKAKSPLDGITQLAGDMFLNGLDFSLLGKTVLYLDPPYPLASRKSSKLVYACEMTDDDHEILLDYVLNNLPNDVDVLISTYPNDLYERKLAAWSKIEFQVKTSQGVATEVLYYNYSDLSLIHDYSFAGDNYRERLRIKRKAQRWVNRLEKMPAYEKQAIFEEILKLPEFSSVTSKTTLWYHSVVFDVTGV